MNVPHNKAEADDVMKLFGLTPPKPAPEPECRRTPDPDPKDDRQFITDVARMTEVAAALVAKCERCGCKVCRLTLVANKVSAWIGSELLRAAYTGDISNLVQVGELVEKLKQPPIG